MIGDSGTFWEYFFFGFFALGAGLIALILDNWMQFAILGLIYLVVYSVVKAAKG